MPISALLLFLGCIGSKTDTAPEGGSCFVHTNVDDADDTDSLRYIIEGAFNNFTETRADCNAYGDDITDGFDQAIKFDTTSSYGMESTTITMNSRYMIGNSYHQLVLGNRDVSSGVVTLDAMTNDLDNVFTCNDSAEPITLRNMTILVKDGLTYDDVITNQRCLVAGGNLYVDIPL